jgi:hypothetical protein
MRNHNRSLFREVLVTMGNALVTAAAVNRGGRPADRNLRGLGIDPADFRDIKRYY